MTFTEADAENDGLIKREVGKQMKKVASTQNPEWYDAFARVCNEIGRNPADVFGEMAVKSLNSQEYSDKVFNAELSPAQLKSDEMRLEDVKYVKQLSDELGLNNNQGSNDPIDRMIEQRLQTITQSPIPRLNKDKDKKDVGGDELAKAINNMNQRLNEMEKNIKKGAGNVKDDVGDAVSDDQSIDELFGGEGEGEEAERVEADDEGASDEPTQEQIDEAMEGVVDDGGSKSSTSEVVEEAFPDVGGEVEEAEVVEEEPSDGDGAIFSSEEAKEE